MSGPPSDYIDVAERIAEFRAKHPDGSLQQVDVKFTDFAGKSWVVYTAAAYRTPDDPRPGHGTAWEPVPGPTAFTRDSELQNAETSAWGRAIVAALAADTKRGVASADEVRNRRPTPASSDQEAQIESLLGQLDPDRAAKARAWLAQTYPNQLTASDADGIIGVLRVKVGEQT